MARGVGGGDQVDQLLRGILNVPHRSRQRVCWHSYDDLWVRHDAVVVHGDVHLQLGVRMGGWDPMGEGLRGEGPEDCLGARVQRLQPVVPHEEPRGAHFGSALVDRLHDRAVEGDGLPDEGVSKINQHLQAGVVRVIGGQAEDGTNPCHRQDDDRGGKKR